LTADLGGGLIKQRVARPGQGRSGGYRMVVAYRAAGRAVLLYGFAKNERDNIDDNELEALRVIGANWLAASIEKIMRGLDEGELKEIDRGDKKAHPFDPGDSGNGRGTASAWDYERRRS